MYLTLSLLYFVLPILKVNSRSFYPPPFLHNPKVPPSVYNGDNQKYLTLPDGPESYPAPPPPPPGFPGYGTASYKDKSGVKSSGVVAGIALWELLKNSHHHRYYGIKTYQNDQPTYHDVIRERYTTKIIPKGNHLKGLEAYNILEMTHYVTFDNKGLIFSSEGNSTCVSVYNAKSLKDWHQMQLNEFNKLYPNSTFPLYTLGNYSTIENFTVIPGRIIHREPISITCCGSSNQKLNLNYLTNGRHPEVNCVNHVGYIPIRKLVFEKREETRFIDTSEWHEIELQDPDIDSR